jgi:hypothetical protein
MARVVAETEKQSWGNVFNKCLTSVVFPLPDGPQNKMSFGCMF